MKKYIFLLLPTFILSQQSIQTITKDFDTSSDSNVEAIVKLNDTKTAAIFSYFGTNTYYNNLHLIDLINKKYELILQSDYNSFSPTNIFSHNNKLFFKSNYRLYHYDGTSTPTQLLTSYNDNIAYVVINNDLYFVIKGDYRNEFYYYNGTSVTQINPIYNAHFIHYATENKIYFSVKNELNKYDLIEFNKVNDTFNIISTTIEVDQNGYGIEYFKNNLFYAINQENKLFLSKLNSLNENSIIKYQSNGIYVPIKIEEIFRSINVIFPLLGTLKNRVFI